MGLCVMLALMLGLLVLSSIGIDGRPTISSSVSLLQAREQCFRSEKLTKDQLLLLDKMSFDNRPHVRRYVRCFWKKLRLWQDNSGFSAIQIVRHFGGPTRLNQEEVIPAVGKCNAKTRQGDTLNWCYRAFRCVMKTPVGDWFRKHMSDVINGNA